MRVDCQEVRLALPPLVPLNANPRGREGQEFCDILVAAETRLIVHELLLFFWTSFSAGQSAARCLCERLIVDVEKEDQIPSLILIVYQIRSQKSRKL